MFGQSILILIPHPDDEVVGAAAAIARATARGARVWGLFLTTGVPELGVAWFPSAARHALRVERRRTEAIAAAHSLSLDPVAFRDPPTRALRQNLAASEAAIGAAIAQCAVDTIWVPAFEGGHQDHDAANALASRFTSSVAVWEFAEYNNAGGQHHRQTFPIDNGSEVVIDLSEVEREDKSRLLATYQSERDNLRHIGVEREAFRPLPRHDYAQPPHAGALYYARFQWVPFRHPRIDFTPPSVVAADIAGFLGTCAAGAAAAIDG